MGSEAQSVYSVGTTERKKRRLGRGARERTEGGKYEPALAALAGRLDIRQSGRKAVGEEKSSHERGMAYRRGGKGIGTPSDPQRRVIWFSMTIQTQNLWKWIPYT
jgi:hypothetical protein